MRPPSEFPLEPPDDYTIEGWLSTMDSRPRVLPRWPESRRMTLVAVLVEDFKTPAEAEAVGYVITKPEQANALVDFENSLDGVSVLFFTVSRKKVMDQCPDLTEDSWQKPQPKE